MSKKIIRRREPKVSAKLRAYLEAIPLPESVKCELCTKAKVYPDGGRDQPQMTLLSDSIDAVGRMWLCRCPCCKQEVEMNFYPRSGV